MPYCTLDEDYWSTIIHAIKQQKCILMLGPDASIDDNHKPCTEVLAQKLAEKIKTVTGDVRTVTGDVRAERSLL